MKRRSTRLKRIGRKDCKRVWRGGLPVWRGLVYHLKRIGLPFEEDWSVQMFARGGIVVWRGLVYQSVQMFARGGIVVWRGLVYQSVQMFARGGIVVWRGLVYQLEEDWSVQRFGRGGLVYPFEEEDWFTDWRGGLVGPKVCKKWSTRLKRIGQSKGLQEDWSVQRFEEEDWSTRLKRRIGLPVWRGLVYPFEEDWSTRFEEDWSVERFARGRIAVWRGLVGTKVWRGLV